MAPFIRVCVCVCALIVSVWRLLRILVMCLAPRIHIASPVKWKAHLIDLGFVLDLPCYHSLPLTLAYHLEQNEAIAQSCATSHLKIFFFLNEAF